MKTNLDSDFIEHRKELRRQERLLKPLLDQAQKFRLSEAAYLELAVHIWTALNTPRSLACKMLLESREYAQLVSLTCDPRTYLDSVMDHYAVRGGQQFRDDYQATELLAKWPNFNHEDLDPVSACEKADRDAEMSCVLSNRRLKAAFAAPMENSAYLHLIFEMQADIARVLGPFCPERWERLCRFGPGKATGKAGTSEYEKLTITPSCTEDFLSHGVMLVSGSTTWLESISNCMPDPECPLSNIQGESYKWEVDIVPGDRNIMVPKNAKTMRGIRPQPGLNVYAQLGLGRMIRTQLQRSGLDLDDQSPNQKLAKLGSKLGSVYVTIDLKGASGHICKELVFSLFEQCPRWLHAMNLTRTRFQLPHGAEDVPANWVPLASYSAMGNGYTFELETLIFWAAVRAIRRKIQDTHQYRVYGDDIICSKEVSSELIPFLAFLGFPLNAKKTFLEGPFRESCGADFWHGTNIRPIHLSVSAEELGEANATGTSVLRWVQTCNQVRRLARNRNNGFGCDADLLPAWRSAVLRIPRVLRESLKGPWCDTRDDYLITHLEDVLRNPLVTRCGNIHALISPRLHIRTAQDNKDQSRLTGAKSVLLYRLSEEDRVTVRFDQTRSWLRRFLQDHTPRHTEMQKSVLRWIGYKTDSSFVVQPSSTYRLGAGWEVFQPVGDLTAWS